MWWVSKPLPWQEAGTGQSWRGAWQGERIPPQAGVVGAAGVRGREGGGGQTLVEELPLFSLNWNPRTTNPQKADLIEHLDKSRAFG